MLTLEKRSGYVYFEYPDRYEYTELIELIQQIDQVCAAENSQKVMVNFLAINDEVSLMDRFKLAVKGAQMINHTVRIACIFHTDRLDRFAENVAVNRGLNTRIFNNMQDALEWLNIESN